MEGSVSDGMVAYLIGGSVSDKDSVSDGEVAYPMEG